MTEIAPGMMVECVKSHNGRSTGRKAFVLKVSHVPMCIDKHGECMGLLLLNWPSKHPTKEWAGCYFRPIGGDKEIEREESQRTGKSAKDNIKNNEYLDFIKLTPTRHRI